MARDLNKYLQATPVTYSNRNAAYPLGNTELKARIEDDACLYSPAAQQTSRKLEIQRAAEFGWISNTAGLLFAGSNKTSCWKMQQVAGGVINRKCKYYVTS